MDNVNQDATKETSPAALPPPAPLARAPATRIVPIALTATVVVIAVLLSRAAWNAYRGAPWTRDGTVRAYVVTVASEVSGRLVSLPIGADQLVHKGDLLMEIDPTDYQIAVATARANVQQAEADLANKQAEAARREQLTTLATSVEEKQTYKAAALSAEATVQHNQAALAQAEVNLERTRIASPVNGYVTNLTAQTGDYVSAGQRVISLINADSFWVDGYFEETQLDRIRIGDTARIALMAYNAPMAGHVSGISRGIEVANAQSDQAGLATVNPIFTWIRLAQRIPVRIEFDHVSPENVLVVGMTATVQINPDTGHGEPLLHSLLRRQAH
jgi:RND family efflux transporter MFP subunit